MRHGQADDQGPAAHPRVCEREGARSLAGQAARQVPGDLLKIPKRGSGEPGPTYAEALDEALCFGWIDGVRKRIDDDAYTIRFTPRRPTSVWSTINIAKVHALEAQGRMTGAGRKAFALRSEAKSGIYAYEQATSAGLSPAETREFKREKAAWKYWEAAPQGYRKVTVRWVVTAKKAETRVGRLARLVAACAAGERLR